MTADRRDLLSYVMTEAHRMRRLARWTMAKALTWAWAKAKAEVARAAAERAAEAAKPAMPADVAERYAYLTEARFFPITFDGNRRWEAACNEAAALRARYQVA